MNFVRGGIFFFVLLILLIFVSSALSEFAHNENQVSIKVNGKLMDLQKAINEDYLVDYRNFPEQDYVPVIFEGHSADEIIVEVNGEIKTLQDAISNNLSNKGLCSKINHSYTKNSLPEGYTIGHYATTILLNSEKTLQDAINEGNFCDQYNYSWKVGDWDVCSSSCGTGTQTRDVWCERNDGEKSSNRGSIFTTDKCKDIEIEYDLTQSCSDTSGCTYSYTNWGSYSGCSVSCGGGTQSRTRSCQRSDGVTVDCSFCGGVCSSSQSCNTQSCYTWNYYSNFNSASSSHVPCSTVWMKSCSSPGARMKCEYIKYHKRLYRIFMLRCG